MEDRLKEYIEKISKSKFDLKYFKEFIGELLTLENKDYLTEKENKEIKSIYKDYIDSYTELVRYTDRERKVISVMVVKLKDGKIADNARSKQRNFIADVLKDNEYDASIVAIYSEKSNNWRLSFVKIEGSFELGKFNQKVSPAKRYSYLFGENEPNHTAKKQLSELLKHMDKKYTVKELEDVFTIEKVTKEFFEQYKKKYNDLYEELENNIYFKQESEKFGFSNEEFCKKLMGQIVFLYFIQKKGWLGVELVPKHMDVLEYQEIIKNKDQLEIDILNKAYRKTTENKYEIKPSYLYSCDKSEAKILSDLFVGTKHEKAWGTGKKDFIRYMFEHCKNNTNKNFYDDFLEPLFYEALNEKRDNQYYKIFNAKIPYLNGGLFEPIKDYRWKVTNFKIDNKIFSDKINNDDGTGILDFFDRYNFTIDEEEPMEKDVAVDPEMLGKIFENLLDVKDRKSKGAFYTPREIVHYMCQESLANYLVNKVGVNYNEIKEFILYGDILVSMDLDAENDILKNHLIGDTILSKMYEIDKALNEVKIADPAVGSGAFPLGMLNEIVRMRESATQYLSLLYKNKPLKAEELNNLLFEGENKRTNYQYKWNAIENSIYAVDIEPSAVDITKLRLWLSLVVDQELENDDDPHTLPNLDCKIMSGNSLIDEYKGIKLFDNEMLETLKSEIKDYSNKKNKLTNAIQISFQHNQKELQLRELEEAKHKYYNAKNKEEKTESKNKIANIRKDYLKQCFEGTSQEVWECFLDEDKKSKKEYFSWQLEFIEVFKENNGFDIVIGNPPYIDSEGMVNAGLSEVRDFISNKYKYTKGNWDIYIAFFELGLILSNNQLIYITPDKWISKPFGESLREAIIPNICSILEAGRKVFETAKVDSIVTHISKKINDKIKIYRYDNKKIIEDKIVEKSILGNSNAMDILFSNKIDLIKKIESYNVVLENIALCENACATSDAYKLKEFVEDIIEYDNNNMLKIVNTGTIDKYISKWGKHNMTYLKDKYMCPIVNKEIFIKEFPNSYSKKSLKMKIIIKGLTLLDCCIDLDGNTVPGKSTMMVTTENKIQLKGLLGILNSKIFLIYIKEKYSSSSYNGGINFTKDMINKLPLNNNLIELIPEISKIVDQILENIENKDKVNELSKNIDQIIYKSFNLTLDEIALIESEG